MGNTSSEPTGAVKELLESKEPKGIQDHKFWEQIFEPPRDKTDTVQGEHTCMRGWPSASIVRHIKQECPKNLATLVRRCVLKLQAATRCKLQSKKAQAQVIGTVRMLTMIMPIMYEDPAWDGFWGTVTPRGVVITLPKENIVVSKEPEPDIPLSEILVNSIVDLCFVPGFTAPRNKEHPMSKYECVADIESEHFIWQAGIGRKKAPPTNAAMDRNQTDLVQLLLVCLSKLMYCAAADAKPQQDSWLTHLTGGKNRKVQNLWISMLNTMLGYDPVGWGLPLGSMFPDVDRQALIEGIADLVAMVVDFRSASEPPENVIANWLSQLTDTEALDFITKGMSTMLVYPLVNPSVSFPAVHHALIILLWRLCDTNDAFVQRLLQQGTVLELVAPVLFYIHEYRLDYSQIGLVHIGVYVVLILSGRRNFAVRLNKEYEPTFKFPVPAFEGNYGDLLMLVIHSLMTCKNAHLQALYECLLTIVVNTSPYLKRTSLVAANKLVHLFEVFSSPRFLFASEDNHHLMFFLLEAFNNMIQYQFEGNQHLVYVIIRRRAVFTRLMGITSSPFVDMDESATAAKPADVVFDPTKAHKAKAASPNATPVVRSSLGRGVAQEKEHFSVESSSGQQQGEAPSTTPAFLPTQEWLESWKTKLPLETIQRLLHVLVPQVEKLCLEKGVTDEAEILQFLQNGTLVGLLPVPHPILIRRHHSVPHSTVWYYSYVLGTVYLRCMQPPIWHGTTVRLFRVKTASD